MSVQLRPPDIEVAYDPNWREHFRVTWAFLYKIYVIRKDRNSRTCIHVSVKRGEARPGVGVVDLQDVKKIAQCVIHFATAIQVLTPKGLRGDLGAMSNWIDNDNFLQKAFSRRKAIDLIESCSSTREVIELVCRDKSLRPWTDQIYFAWNFRALYKKRSIEFRSAGTNLDSDTTISWAEIVLLFVQAAVQIPTSESLRTIPADVGALKQFLGVDKLKNLNPIFSGKGDEERMQPEILQFRGQLTQSLQARLDADDERSGDWLANRSTEQGPWTLRDDRHAKEMVLSLFSVTSTPSLTPAQHANK